jgi:hypothetical protein
MSGEIKLTYCLDTATDNVSEILFWEPLVSWHLNK